jgi:hypothetical protein
MVCPLYGRSVVATSSGPRLMTVPQHVCGLTQSNPCDMEMQGMDPDVSLCRLYALHEQEYRGVMMQPDRKQPGIEVLPSRKRKERRA